MTHPPTHAPHPIVCLSHLRWHFVYQRPQHLISRLARHHPVLFVEEPLPSEDGDARVETSEVAPGVTLAVPRLPASGCDGSAAAEAALQALLRPELRRWLRGKSLPPIAWVYSPMAFALFADLPWSVVVYDCMDELSAFRFAPAALLERERALLRRADLVFAGGPSLHAAKKTRHPDVHLFPSSVDVAHFRSGAKAPEPQDLTPVPRPRIGFAGVIDERMDLALLAAAADARPQWQWVLVGPVVKVDAAALPRRPNIHHLGPKAYAELPAYLAHWDVAMMPFALNEATRFISPTKTPEYLAAGRTVASTPVRDVVQVWGDCGLVCIGEGPQGFVDAVDQALALARHAPLVRRQADRLLAPLSWDRTAAAMGRLLAAALGQAPRGKQTRREAAAP